MLRQRKATLPAKQKGFALIPLITAAVLLLLVTLFVAGKKPQLPFSGTGSSDWTITEGDTSFMRGTHMGVYNDFNQYMVKTLPNEYFEYLRDLNANWVGLSVGLFVEDSLDSTVERVYTSTEEKGAPGMRTHTDDELRRLIRRLRSHGFHVYVTLAFEDLGIAGEHPYHRYSFGVEQDGRSDWPWNKDHPDHERFVKEFWQTYTEQAVHFARILQEESVEMYSLGAETEGLFRTREADGTRGGYFNELEEMLAAVRAVYKGEVIYNMHATAIDDSIEGAAAYRLLWEDLDFDAIGISAYFSLLAAMPTGITPISELENGWERIFTQHLIPLQEKHPDKPIIFTEHQNYTSEYIGYDGPLLEELGLLDRDSNLLVRKTVDTNKNGVGDGQEQQASLQRAFFKILGKYPGAVDGTFSWGEDYWEAEWGGADSYWDEEGVRGKEAEKVLREEYAKLRGG